MAQRERLQDGGEAANHAKGKGGVKQRDCLQRTARVAASSMTTRRGSSETSPSNKKGKENTVEAVSARRVVGLAVTLPQERGTVPHEVKSLSGRAETLFVTNPMQNDVKKARIVTVGFFCFACVYRRGHSTVGKPTSYARRWTSIRRKYQTLHGMHVRCPGGNPCTTEGTLRQRDAVHPGLIGNQARTGIEAEVASRAAALLSDFSN